VGLTALCLNVWVFTVRAWLPMVALLVPLSLALFAAYIFGGLRASQARPEVYSALLRAPFYALWKFALYIFVRLKGGKKASDTPEEWVRTERTPMATDSPRSLEDAA
jgi:hypothetical protein